MGTLLSCLFLGTLRCRSQSLSSDFGRPTYHLWSVKPFYQHVVTLANDRPPWYKFVFQTQRPLRCTILLCKTSVTATIRVSWPLIVERASESWLRLLKWRSSATTSNSKPVLPSHKHTLLRWLLVDTRNSTPLKLSTLMCNNHMQFGWPPKRRTDSTTLFQQLASKQNSTNAICVPKYPNILRSQSWFGLWRCVSRSWMKRLTTLTTVPVEPVATSLTSD